METLKERTLENGVNGKSTPGVVYSYGCEIKREKGFGCGINENNVKDYLKNPEEVEIWESNREKALEELKKPIIVKTY